MPKKRILLIGWVMWLLAALFYSLDYFQHTAPSVLLEPISLGLGISIIHVGDIMGIYFPIYAISQIPAGMILDRFGYRKVLSIACGIVSLGLVSIAISSDTSLLITGRVLIAIGSAFAFLGALNVASDWLTPTLFPIAVGLTNTLGVMGGMFGQTLLSHMIVSFDWRTSLWAIAIFGFALAALLFIFLRKKAVPLNTPPASKLSWAGLSIARHPKIWLLGFYAGIMVGTVVNAFSELYDVIFLQYSYHLTLEQAALMSTMIFVGIAVGGPIHGVVSNLFPNKKYWMIIGNILTTVIFAIIVLIPELIPTSLLYILYFSLGFFVSSMLLAFSIAKEVFPKSAHGISMAFINMIIGLCGAVFQPLLGELFYLLNGNLEKIENTHTFSIGFLVLLIPLVISFICCLKIKLKPIH